MEKIGDNHLYKHIENKPQRIATSASLRIPLNLYRCAHMRCTSPAIITIAIIPLRVLLHLQLLRILLPLGSNSIATEYPDEEENSVNHSHFARWLKLLDIDIYY
jgi:hypothetical protein